MGHPKGLKSWASLSSTTSESILGRLGARPASRSSIGERKSCCSCACAFPGRADRVLVALDTFGLITGVRDELAVGAQEIRSSGRP